jgi:hypothetical protein
MDELLELIRSWAQRSKLQSSLYWLFFGLTCGLGAALVVAVLARIFPLFSTSNLIALAFTCAILGICCAVGAPWLRAWHTTPSAWAKHFDQVFMLKERLSTALELRAGTLNTSNISLRRKQQRDAAQVAQKLDIQTLLPLHFSTRFALYAAGIGLALVITIALPNPQQQVLANRAQMQQVLDEQMQQLELAKQQIQAAPSLTDTQKQHAIQALDDTLTALSDPNTTPEKAMAAINDAQSKLDALRDQTAHDQVNDLQNAGQSLAPSEQTNPLANSLENGDLNQAADQLRNLTQNNGQSLSNVQRQQLADQLEQMANSLQQSDGTAAQQLSQAARQLRDQQDQAAQQTLNQFADKLDQTAQKQAANQQIGKAQSSMEDTRRALSEANQQAQASASTAQNQSGQSTSGQNSATYGGQQTPQPGADGATQSGPPKQQSQSADMAQSNNSPSGISSNGASEHHEDTGSDSSVLNPQRITTAGESVVLPDNKAQNVPNPNAQANPGVSNQATIPYQQVYPQYARTADEAIGSGQVPSDLRDYVRDYFSSLDPHSSK